MFDISMVGKNIIMASNFGDDHDEKFFFYE